MTYQGVMLNSGVVKFVNHFLESHAVSTCMKLAGSLILKAGLQCDAFACAILWQIHKMYKNLFYFCVEPLCHIVNILFLKILFYVTFFFSTADYLSPTISSVNFHGSIRVLTVSYSVTDDNIAEPDETLSLTIQRSTSSAQTPVSYSTKSVDIKIIDNDGKNENYSCRCNVQLSFISCKNWLCNNSYDCI